MLVGGDPGIGKSTLLLQVCRNLSEKGVRVLYISGEESLQQIKIRAERIGTFGDSLTLLCETNLDTIKTVIDREKPQICLLYTSDMKQIVALMLKELTDRCEKQMGIHLTVRDSVKKHIVDKAYDPKYGARPLRRQIQNDIEDELAEEILSGKVKKDMEVVVTIHKEKVVFETK